MVDVSGKAESVRAARAEGLIRLSPEAAALVKGNSGPKGDVLSTAEIAGTMAAKRTAELVPLCHPIGLDRVHVAAELDTDVPGVRVRSEVKAVGRTGVEMEALTCVTIALLTVYDMVKAVGHDMEIISVRLVEKTGGTRGDWRRADDEA
jgi:cyclic pyranopterin phosphate synthase